MPKPAQLPRLRISMLLLVIVPWAIVSIASFHIWRLPEIPVFESRDAREMQAIANALADYAARYGEYPPDFTSGNPRQEIDEHLKKIFPDRDADRDLPANLHQLGPDNALAFWLGGFYRGNSKCPLTGKIYLGLHPDTNEEVWIDLPPGGVMAEVYDGDEYSLLTSLGIVSVAGKDQAAYEDLISNYAKLRGSQKDMLNVLMQKTPMYSFAANRLSLGDAYRPRCCPAPWIYFRAASYGTAQFRGNPRWGVAAPYRFVSEDGTRDYVRPDSFQLICAGRDSYFGQGSIATNDAAYEQGHADNFANFAEQPLGAQQLIVAREQAIEARNLSFLAAVICTLVYPLSFLLDRRESGSVVLSRITNKQFKSMGCSAEWRERLESQRHHRRNRALGRLRAK